MLHPSSRISCEIQSLQGDILPEHGKTFDEGYLAGSWSQARTGKAVCWVETPAEDEQHGGEASQGFLIMWNTNGYGQDLAVYVTLDGAKQRIPTPHYANQDYGLVTGEPGPDGSERPYQFSRIARRAGIGGGDDTEDDELEEAGAALKRGVGSIIVEFKVCTIGANMANLDFLDEPNEGQRVTERGVKGQLIHSTRFGAAKNVGTTKFVFTQSMGEAVATFEFKYRNRDLLEAEGLLDPEAEPEPASQGEEVKPAREAAPAAGPALAPAPAPTASAATSASSAATSSSSTAPAPSTCVLPPRPSTQGREPEDVKPNVKSNIAVSGSSSSSSTSAIAATTSSSASTNAGPSSAQQAQDVKPNITRTPSTPPEDITSTSNAKDKGKKRARTSDEDSELKEARERAKRAEEQMQRMGEQLERASRENQTTMDTLRRLEDQMEAAGMNNIFAWQRSTPSRSAAENPPRADEEERKPAVKAEDGTSTAPIATGSGSDASPVKGSGSRDEPYDLDD